jgi:hypothetical protein
MSQLSSQPTVNDKVVFGTTSTTGNRNITRSTEAKKYKKYTDDDVILEALEFYILPQGSSFKKFAKRESKKVPPSTMRRIFSNCGIFEMKSNGRCVGDIEKVLKEHLKQTRTNEQNRTGPASSAKRYLTNNEELAIVQLARLMGSCGAGVGRDELLDVINSYIHHQEDSRMIEPATMKMVDQMLKRHKELTKLVSASSMDPQRARQATKETRDAVFFKLDSYIKTLHSMGLCDWKSYKDVPDEDKFNMDEVGADTTKHRKKVIADRLDTRARVFQVTPEGDGKMNIHVTLCITTCGNGLFQDTENSLPGACAPVIIHCDKTKTKEKEDEERRKQRAGEKPSERFVAERFRAGIDLPEIKVLTTRNGSMTQETFDEYAIHLVKSQAENHGPKILFLDGHGSRWNRQTLSFLMKNKIYPFFFASHTSIWAQPNDGGPNLRLHNCIEEAVRARRRTASTPDVAYFNSIACDGWRKFVAREREELRAQTTNTTQNSYHKAGVGSLNPFCVGWTTAIETTGRVLNNKEGSVKQYEPVAIETTRKLTIEEKLILREGLGYIDETSDLGDLPVAILRAQEVLGRWRDAIRDAVSEGEQEQAIAEASIPLPVTPAQTIAFKIVELAVVDVNAIDVPEEKTREEKAVEITKNIVRTSYVTDCIKVTYLSSSNEEESEESDGSGESETIVKLNGRAIKTHLADNPDDNSWNVTVRGTGEAGRTFTVCEKDLLGGKFVVERAYNDMCAQQKKKVLAKNKRMRQKEAREQETKLAAIARERREALEKEEYKKLIEIFASGRTYEWKEFQNLLERMRQPFSCSVDGRDVTVTEVDAAIMMEGSALEEIGKILVSNNKRANDNTDGQAPKRRRNNAACNTTRGATGFDALHGAARRDHRDNTASREKLVKGHKRDKEAINRILTLVLERKQECTEAYMAAIAAARAAKKKREAVLREAAAQRLRAATAAAQEGAATVGPPNLDGLRDALVWDGLGGAVTGSSEQRTKTTNEGSDRLRDGLEVFTGAVAAQEGAATISNSSDGLGEALSQRIERANINCDVADEENYGCRAEEEMNVSVTEYWQVRESSLGGTLDLFLRLFVPKSGVLQKNKSIKWKMIQDKIVLLGVLTKTQFDSRVEDLTRKLRVIDQELAELAPDPMASEQDNIVTT